MLALRLAGRRGLFGGPPTALPLGSRADILCARADPTVELRARVSHEHVHYFTPLQDWAAVDAIAFRPEAPGRYTVIADWRGGGGAHGVARLAFTVDAGAPVSLAPAAITLADGARLWTPSGWEAAIFAQHEPAVLARLAAVLPRGGVAWDVGANLGVYTLALAPIAGAAGAVYAFEPNPLCVYFLRLNLHANGVDNVDIVPVALSDHAGPLEFTMNFGNCHLGLGATSTLHGQKVGHAFGATGAAGDAIAAALALRPPDLIKIDVEGGEGAVLRGLQRTLAAHRPALLIELHGRAATAAAMEALAPHGYRFELLDDGTRFASAAALAAAFPEATRQALGLPA